MFTHLVFFKLKDRTDENMKKAKNILLSAEGQIPQLKYIEVGADIIGSERSYDIALITKFESYDKMQEYQVHPYHVEKILKPLKEIVCDSKAVDY